MKKIFMLILLSLLIVGCSSNAEKKSEETSHLKLDSFINAFVSEGIEVDEAEKPSFSMIGAKDGVIFYIGTQVVKIYEYDSEKDIKQAVEDYPQMEDWPKNGLLVLETDNDQAKEIFNSVK